MECQRSLSRCKQLCAVRYRRCPTSIFELRLRQRIGCGPKKYHTIAIRVSDLEHGGGHSGSPTKAHDSYSEIAALQSWQGQPPPYPGYSQPPTQENGQPGANGAPASLQSAAFTTLRTGHFNSFHSPQALMSQQQQAPQTRGRSSSMLSAYSGFTDGADHSLLPPEHRSQLYNWNFQSNTMRGAPQMMDDRRESEGSGNSGSLNGGSTGYNSWRPEAKVFVPGSKAAPLSPIGPPGSKGKEKAPQSPLQNHANAGYGPVR